MQVARSDVLSLPLIAKYKMSGGPLILVDVFKIPDIQPTILVFKVFSSILR